MDEQIFKEYEDCRTCRNVELKNSNLHNIRQHLQEVHGQSEISLYICSRKPGFRQVFMDLHNLTKPYHEPNFDKDLKRAFYDKAWEMIVCRSLLNSGRSVMPNVVQAGPDFTTDKGYIECVNAAPAQGYVSKISEPNELIMEQVPESDIQLRITSVFVKKSKIIKGYLDKAIIDPSKPCIIAINYARSHDFAWADSEELSDNFVLRSLFGMGPLSMTIDPDDPQPNEFKVSFQPRLQKSATTQVPADYFLTDAHKHIAAVIYSNYQINSDQSEEVSIVNNPFAEVAISLSDYSDMHRIFADLKRSTLHKMPRGEAL